MKRALRIAGLLLLVAPVASAAEPWKSKPYRQWDQKDIQKILTDSPWVKRTVVNVSWGNGAAGAAEQGTEPRPAAPGYGGAPEAGPPGERTSGAGGGEGMGIRETVFIARWVSSRTMRRALIRLQVLNQQLQEQQAEQFLQQPVNALQVMVSGPDMTPFAGLDEATLLRSVWLELKTSHRRLSPTRVQLQRTPEGRLVDVLFDFPRQSDGQPVLAPTEKQAELVCKLPQTSLNFSFDPRRMDDADGSDW